MREIEKFIRACKEKESEEPEGLPADFSKWGQPVIGYIQPQVIYENGYGSLYRIIWNEVFHKGEPEEKRISHSKEFYSYMEACIFLKMLKTFGADR